MSTKRVCTKSRAPRTVAWKTVAVYGNLKYQAGRCPDGITWTRWMYKGQRRKP